MATRILSVRERALRAVCDRLMQIQEVDGYNTSVRHVRRIRDIVQMAADPPEIHLAFPAGSKTDHRSTELKETRLLTTLFFYGARTAGVEPDTDYNLFLADIIRVLNPDANASQVIDASATPLGPSYAVLIESEWEDQPLYFEGLPDAIAGRMDIVIQFSWSLTDPRKWDDQDQLVAEQ